MLINNGLSLTKNEKLVLYGLVKYPEFNDKELSKKLKVKLPTVTAIRTKLKNKGYYETKNILWPKAIGYEIMAFMTGEFNPDLPEKTAKERKDYPKSCPEIAVCITTPMNGFALILLKDFDTCESFMENIKKCDCSHSLLRKQPELKLFAIKSMKLFRFFDYSGLIKHAFDLKADCGSDKEYKNNIDFKRLSKNEQILLYNILQHPNEKDIELSKRTGLTRQTVSKIKKYLLQTGIVRKVNEPNLELLGFELIVVSHSKMKHNLKDRLDLVKNEKFDIPNAITVMSNDCENVAIGAYKNYTEIFNLHAKMQAMAARYNINEEDGLMILPTSEIKYSKFDFAGIVKKVFDLN